MTEKVTNILIAENIPSLNKGEMTILEGTLETFAVLGKTRVSMVSDAPEIDRPRCEPRIRIVDVRMWSKLKKSKAIGPIFTFISSLVLISEHLLFVVLYRTMGQRTLRLMRSDLWEEYARCDVIIIGHDNTYGVASGIAHFYYLYLPIFARIIGKPVAFYGGSILKEQRPVFLWAMALRFSLKWINLVTLRERLTYQRLKRHNLLNARVTVTGDPAFLLRTASYERVADIMKLEEISTNSKPLVGMTITHSVASNAFPDTAGASSYQRHIAVIAEAIDHIVAKYDATILFVPHCIGPEPALDDRIIAAQIIQKCDSRSRVKAITGEYSASELKGLIGQFKLFIGERIHSTINAMSGEVPSIVLVKKSDQRSDIVDMLGQGSAICFVDNLDSKTLIEKIDLTWSRAEAIKQELSSQVAYQKERSMNNGRLLLQLLNANRSN